MHTPLRKSFYQTNLFKGIAFLLPWLIGFAVFTLLPATLSLYYSLCDYSLLQPPMYVGLDNYSELMRDPVFHTALKNTAIYSIMAIPCGLIVSLLIALLLNQPVRGRSIYRTIIFLPSLVPLVAGAMLWLWVLNPRMGLINQFLENSGANALLHNMGITTPLGWLTDPKLVLPSLALMSLWSCGYTVTILLAGLQDVPTELLEAAHIDGAGPIRRLWSVTLPMLSPVIFFNVIMAIIGAMQVFALPYIMTSGGPGRSSYFFTMYLYDSAFTYLRMGYASAMAWIQLLIVLALTAIAFWTSRRWVHIQGK